MLLTIQENHTAFNEHLQNAEIYFLVRLLALGDKGCVLILLAHDILACRLWTEWLFHQRPREINPIGDLQFSNIFLRYYM